MLPDLLIAERVKVPLASHSKDEVLRELVQLAMPSAGSAALDSVVGAVLGRENLSRTGIGSGIAIPHGRTNQVDTHVRALGRISRVVRHESIREELTRATNAGAFVGLLVTAEAS